MREKILRRVRSLLEVAKEGSGATPNERSTARRLADRLMTENNLAEVDIPEREAERRIEPPPPPNQSPIFVFRVFGLNDVHVNIGACGDIRKGDPVFWDSTNNTHTTA